MIFGNSVRRLPPIPFNAFRICAITEHRTVEIAHIGMLLFHGSRFPKHSFCPKPADRFTNRLCGVSGNSCPGGQVWVQSLQDLGDPPDYCSRCNYTLPGHLHVSLHIRDVTDICNGEKLYAIDNGERYAEMTSPAKHSTRAVCVSATV